MSVVVSLNSMELLVDLMRFPGQLIPFSAKAIFISHISAAGESDSAENDSCDSPLEPNSPLYGLSDKVETEGYAYVLNTSSQLCVSGLVYSYTVIYVLLLMGIFNSIPVGEDIAYDSAGSLRYLACIDLLNVSHISTI